MERTLFILGPRGQIADCADAVVVLGHVGDDAASDLAVVFEDGQ